MAKSNKVVQKSSNLKSLPPATRDSRAKQFEKFSDTDLNAAYKQVYAVEPSKSLTKADKITALLDATPEPAAARISATRKKIEAVKGSSGEDIPEGITSKEGWRDLVVVKHQRTMETTDGRVMTDPQSTFYQAYTQSDFDRLSEDGPKGEPPFFSENGLSVEVVHQPGESADDDDEEVEAPAPATGDGTGADGL